MLLTSEAKTPKRLKIVHVTPDLHMGGGGITTFLKTLFYCLDVELVEIIIVTNQSEESDRRSFEALGVSIVSRLSYIHSQLDEGNALEIMHWMIGIFKKLKPDIVHTHLFWGDTLGRQAAFRVGVPVIISNEQNMNLDENEKHRKIKRRLAHVTDCVVCCSEAVRNYSRKVDNIPDALMTVIHNSIILNEYKFHGNLESRVQNKFVYAGRLEPQKNPFLLIESFAKIAVGCPDCHLSIIGNGSLMKKCQDKVKVLGLSTFIQFYGYKQNPWLGISPGSIFVLPSAFEGMPFVILEAMAIGHLCILPKIGGIDEIANTGTEAIFYEAGSRASLMDSMRLALNISEEQRINMIKTARQRVADNFDAYQMSDKYLSLYRNLYLTKKIASLGTH
jgi:glycosyltransferase involved in cell wall biosynthesis